MGKPQAAQVKGKGTLFGKAERFAEWTRIPAAAAKSLGGGRKGKVPLAFAGIFLTGPGEGTDGLKDLIGGAMAGREVTDLGKKKWGGRGGVTTPGRSTGGGDGD